MHHSIKIVATIVVWAAMAGSARAGSDDDPIVVKIDLAKLEHRKTVSDATADVLHVIDSRRDAVRKAGDLERVQRLDKIHEVFRAGDDLPPDIDDRLVLAAGKRFDLVVKRANLKLIGAYRLAVRQATRANRIDLAESLQAELDNIDPDATRSLGDFYKMGGRRTVPVYMKRPAKGTDVRPDGLKTEKGHYVVSKRADFVHRDFVFEIMLRFKESDGRQIAFIGIGSGVASEDGPYHEPRDAVYLRFHTPPMSGGEVGLKKEGTRNHELIGKVGKWGEHLVRITKTGKSLTFHVDVHADGKPEGDVTHKIEDVSAYAPFLKNTNSRLFFGSGATFTRIRMGTPARR